ncbi:hypothetical protein [Rhodospirillum rubrum]|uniref:hypothetical protein n=1 Tax=Rhodospirillum rubrum TaxID=1085 RepID=UPI000229D578|nr:hypothetical protein [Rhodospirillum rubrum]AEO49423.1 hypothetical protein F11_14805 [Rhodospirillum rubrum F11]
MDDLRFKIDAFRPDTIPMARLAEYMAGLAALLGNEKSVHFLRLDPGSIEIVHRVDLEDRPKVEDRLASLRLGNAPADAVKAHHLIDDMLANDNATGVLTSGQDLVVIAFTGGKRPKSLDYGTFSQPGSFDGIPIKVGGLGELVPIHLQEIGPALFVHNCVATRAIARDVAKYLFQSPIRAHGEGRWKREANDGWTLKRFVITSFEPLDDAPLESVVARLRDIDGNGWRDVTRPLKVLRDIRGEEITP